MVQISATSGELTGSAYSLDCGEGYDYCSGWDPHRDDVDQDIQHKQGRVQNGLQHSVGDVDPA